MANTHVTASREWVEEKLKDLPSQKLDGILDIIGVPTGNYADMSDIAERLDTVIRTLKGAIGPDGSTMYFWSMEDGSTVSMTYEGTDEDKASLEYSLDNGETWENFVLNATVVDLDKGKWMLIRATEDAEHDEFAGHRFDLSGSLSVGGDIMSLLPDTPDTDTLSEGAFYGLFESASDLKDASDLILPSTTSVLCFKQMFSGCTGLMGAPKLPATSLSEECYNGMFYNCTSLVTAPELPATSLAAQCYIGMFEGCTSLVTAPELPATSLAPYCYQSMFNGCTSLMTAPELPATSLAEGCYSGMFNNCTRLVTAPELPATSLADQCYSGMFSNCTSLVTAPELPATSLAEECYDGMFSNCTSLVTAPELPAETLVFRCYNGMFNGCTHLNTVSAYFGAFNSDIQATDSWLHGVSATGTFNCRSTLAISERGENTVPSGWTIVGA